MALIRNILYGAGTLANLLGTQNESPAPARIHYFPDDGAAMAADWATTGADFRLAVKDTIKSGRPTSDEE